MMNITETKQLLERRHKALSERISDMEGALRQEHSANFSEQAIEREDEEVLERLEKEALDEIRAIEAALQRMDADTYGVCTGCGDDIDEKRLKILPYASRCIRCAQ